MEKEDNDLTIAYMAGYHKAKGECKDDFESRTCENCKHSYGNHPDTKACDVIHGWISKDFGCNKFERKDK